MYNHPCYFDTQSQCHLKSLDNYSLTVVLIMGTVLAMAVSGFLCASSVDNGWTYIFYVYGNEFEVL